MSTHLIESMSKDGGDEGPSAVTGPVADNGWKSKFFTIWGGQCASLFGSQLVQFAIVWWLTMETGSATVLAGAAAMAYAPQIVLGPIAGTFVDRWHRRRVMIASDSLIAGATVVLAALFALGVVEVWHVLAVLAVRASGSAFHWPAMAAATSMMVPEKHLSRVGGLNQAIVGLAGVVAPPMGAVAIAVLPMQGVLAIDVLTAVLAVSVLSVVRIPEPVRKDDAKGVRATFKDMRDGFRFIKTWPGAAQLIGLILLVNLFFAPADALTPILVTQRFAGGVVEFATLQSAVCVGIVAGGLLLAVWGGTKRRIVTALVALMLAGVGIAAVGLSPPTMFLAAVVAIFVAGFAVAIANGSLNAVLQASIPKGMQGRVFSLLSSMSVSAAPIGLAFGGPLSDAFGAAVVFVLAGVVMAVGGGVALFMPSFMRVEDNIGAKDAKPAASETRSATAEDA